MFSWLKKNKKEDKTASTPLQTRIYAIGDIHGRFDLLQQMQNLIMQDSASAGAGVRKVIIYLGDFIDRGAQSKQVIDSFINNKIENFEQIVIKGNHENAMVSFIDNPAVGDMWLMWGGGATMESYGVSLKDSNGNKRNIEDLQANFKESLTKEHLKFLQNLPVKHQEGDYVFVHAGIKPGISLEGQTSEDMMMIRGEFIYSDNPLPGKVVVFGHTIFDKPFCEAGKIGVDTGAYITNKLTAVVLEDNSVRFITT